MSSWDLLVTPLTLFSLINGNSIPMRRRKNTAEQCKPFRSFYWISRVAILFLDVWLRGSFGAYKHNPPCRLVFFFSCFLRLRACPSPNHSGNLWLINKAPDSHPIQSSRCQCCNLCTGAGWACRYFQGFVFCLVLIDHPIPDDAAAQNFVVFDHLPFFIFVLWFGVWMRSVIPILSRLKAGW